MRCVGKPFMTPTESTQLVNGDAAQTERGSNGRREVFKAMAIAAGATLAGASLLGGRAQAALDPPLTFSDLYEPTYLNLPGLPGGKDIKVLNYALTLEDLESDLYKQAMQRLTIGGKNKLGHTISGLGLSLDEPDVFFINQFASVEAEHRDFLRRSLNGLIDGIAVRPYKYDFGMENKSRADVLDLLITVEDTGAKAYLGAVPYLHSRAFITAAAAIQGNGSASHGDANGNPERAVPACRRPQAGRAARQRQQRDRKTDRAGRCPRAGLAVHRQVID